MEIDLDKIDDTVLALLWLTLHDERRASKGFDWGRRLRGGYCLTNCQPLVQAFGMKFKRSE